jgi:hypothetical protein
VNERGHLAFLSTQSLDARRFPLDDISHKLREYNISMPKIIKNERLRIALRIIVE